MDRSIERDVSWRKKKKGESEKNPRESVGGSVFFSLRLWQKYFYTLHTDTMNFQKYAIALKMESKEIDVIINKIN